MFIVLEVTTSKNNTNNNQGWFQDHIQTEQPKGEQQNKYTSNELINPFSSAIAYFIFPIDLHIEHC